ncbi:argininosuccinate synthase-related protein [Burkholderia orbicola]|uniref:argininosuccinate synthase-related protein n=1 Tax=Burkholderia orbicola TaxID=2978683 RepID=UPI00264B66D8|nr:argininosuccinate synthase-related protein [Burkholderia orbicola]MDN7780180.1 argininosuccinate synthase-related protein [Burkholderia orbicola]
MRNSYFIRSLQDLNLIASHCNHVLTLFSGGLDSTYVLSQLANKKCRVTALAVDLGEGGTEDELEHLAQQFQARLVVVDGREMFAEQAVLPAIAANARYMGIYPISSSLSRPIIAKIAVETASKLGCDAIVHTANQSQNSLRRLNGAISQLGYPGFFGTPYEYSAISRPQKISELAAHGLRHFEARSVSGDANLWCREFESGMLDNPEGFEVPQALFRWTEPRSLVGVDTHLSLTFERGRPVALNGTALPPVELIALANETAGMFGIGRHAGLEHLEQGEKVLEVRETPAANVLMDAFRHLETATLDAELLREKLVIEQLWVREAVEGRWYGSLRLAANSFVAEISKQVSGTVKFKLRPGVADVCAIRADSPRYLTDRDQWEKLVARARGSRELEMAVES